MKLILKKAMANLGEAGEVVDVKDGYGRNFLIPQGIAYEASEANLARIEEEQAKTREKTRRERLEAHRRASQLEGLLLTFSERAGEDGKLFGSVTVADIVEKANADGELDFELEKKAVGLEEPIKALGDTTVVIRLHPEVEVEIEVRVEEEKG
ncbi:MAG: 50S ribosomal protein L9 [Gemmatimonadota bacterium]|nr:50S ribosomal protein L9 [Gemmatimonadota bacterium]MDH3424299.1 50S ribosomal protein L9 [Gemmatimonadota bacterium]